MDSNKESAKPLNRDQFRQSKGNNNEKKGNTGYRPISGSRMYADYGQQGGKSHALWNQNSRRGSYAPKAVTGNAKEIVQEFRVVRDNRVNPNASTDVIPGSHQTEVTSNAQAKSGNLTEKQSTAENTNGLADVCQNLNGRCDSGPSHIKDAKSSDSGKESLPKDKQIHISNSTRMASREVKAKSEALSETLQSAIGVYSSSSDPVHVPTFRPAGTAGAIQREVGVVGARRQSSDRPVTCASNSALASKTITSGMATNKSVSGGQYNVKLHQPVMAHHKATHPNMEWKAKSNNKFSADSHVATTQASQEQATDLSEKFQDNASHTEHVIIPQHLQVPESERAGLMFGSFGAGCDSIDDEESNNGHCSSTPATLPVGVIGEPVTDQPGVVNSQVRTSISDDSAFAAKPELSLPVNNESTSPRDIETYPDVGLVQIHNFTSSSTEPQPQKSTPGLADYTAYEPHLHFDKPFSDMVIEDNTREQHLSSAHEQALSTHVTDEGAFSNMSMVQQQLPFTQLYPQVHISNYTNFVPYQQIFSPLYVPQLLMPNYSNNSAQTYPTCGGNYLMMPEGSPQLTSSMKYGSSQYKPAQAGMSAAGYGTYTNPAGYTVGTIGSTAGMKDVSRINFKDNNIYASNPQFGADNWIQTPRELASLQQAACYNLPGQAQAHPAFLPAAHAASPTVNSVAYPSPHPQYPGLYHPSQPGGFAAQTNHIIHQQVQSGLPGNPGMAMVPAAANHVGAYHQSQLGHLGWTNNF